MIYGIGNDLVEYTRIAAVYQRFTQKLPKRILSVQEQLLFQQSLDKPRFIAKRFAYKEAIVKAMGTGLRKGLRFQDFSILSNELGKPVVSYSKKANNLLEELGINKIHVSLSDEKNFIFVVAVAES